MLCRVTNRFHVYPTGATGVALLLLRVSISACLGLVAMTSATMVTGPIVIAVILALLVGIATRIVAGVSACIAVIVCFECGGLIGFSAAQHGLAAMALSLLGAGGYSIDAVLFGRRVIQIDR
jgi:hypothetical protein